MLLAYMNLPRKRTRLSPEARKDQLLDTAKQMVIESGLQSFTMEGLARTAAVSSPLIYNYFKSRKILLQNLLERESQDITSKLNEEISAAESFEEIVRISIASNFDHHAPGNILPILQSQPEIAISQEARREKQSKQVARYLAQNLAKNYHLTRAQAAQVMFMSSGASIAAAEYAAFSKADRTKTIDTALAYVLAGIKHIAEQAY